MVTPLLTSNSWYLAATFLHGWALAIGGAAVALPLVIHYLTRPRPVRVELSTIRFLLEAVEQRRTRYRLRDFLVLLLRGLAVALLAFVFARPMIGRNAEVRPEDAASEVRIVVLDASGSMSAVSRGVAVFERARAAAGRYLESRPGRRCNLLVAGAKPRAVFDRPSVNQQALSEELGRCRVLSERMDVKATLATAAEMFSAAAVEGVSQRRELVIVSDFQRSSWAGVDFSVLPQDTRIELESVAPAEGLENLAVLSAGVVGRAEQGREARLEVEVANFTRTARRMEVAVTLGGAMVRLDKLVGAGAKAVLTGEVVLPAAGWQTGEARLLGVEDALAADDVRFFAAHVRTPPTYVLLTRQAAAPRAVSSHFLERALAPTRGQRMIRMDPGLPDRETLGGADLLVLDHPGKLTGETVALLTGMVRRGRSMLYVASEAADATNLRLIAEAAGNDWKMPVELQPAPAGGRHELFLAEVRKDDPLFAIFGESLGASIGALRFSGGLASRRVDRGLADDILMTYSDRSACLAVSACGNGTVAILNADLQATNLVGSAVFVPLVGELTGRLLAERGGSGSAVCGEPLFVPLGPEAGNTADLKITGPEGCGEIVDEAGTAVWRWPGTGAPGIYRVLRAEHPLWAIGAGLPADEGDLATLDRGLMESRLAGGRTLVYHAASTQDEQQDRWWVYLAMGVVACMIAEVLVLKVFRA